jgi:hypothetical protein
VILEGAMLLLQLGLMGLLVALSSASARNEMERALNPAMLLCFFYTLWMLIPQAFVLMSDHPVIGLDHLASTARAAATLPTQLYLTLFLGSVLLGYAAALGLCAKPAASAQLQPPPVRLPLWGYGAFAYAMGIAAFFFLGRSFHALPDGTMRSALVKNPTGQVLMALSFFGSFGVAYLAAHLWLGGKRLMPIALFLVYGYLVLQLGARGRILWPLVTAAMFVSGHRSRISLSSVLVCAVIGLMLLSLMDPLVFGLRYNDYSRFREALSPTVMFQTLFYARNFDGFANLLFITHNDLIPAQPGLLWRGARDVYMETYFPGVYRMGVAFPTTIPGEFWLAGKAPLLGAMSLIYGFALGSLHLYLRNARAESQVWLYLLLAPWVTAVGGELVESLQKMIAACVPALLWIAAGWCVRPGHVAQSPGMAQR